MFPALQAGTLPPKHRNTFPSNENHIFQSATNISITSESTSYFSFNSEGKGWLPTGVPLTTNTQNRGACASQHRFSELKVSLAKLKSAEMFCQLHLSLDEPGGSELPFAVLVAAIALAPSSQLRHPDLHHPPPGERAIRSK